MNPLTLVIELTFVALFVATLVTYLRRRDPLNRDVMFIFASLAGLFVVAGISALCVAPRRGASSNASSAPVIGAEL
jgi:hypothetical protein